MTTPPQVRLFGWCYGHGTPDQHHRLCLVEYVDAHGRTNIPGVFAGGDATTTPFKQIVIAAGDGAKCALSAFDYLIRMPVAVEAA